MTRRQWFLKVLSPFIAAFGGVASACRWKTFFDTNPVLRVGYRGETKHDVGFVHAPYEPLKIEKFRVGVVKGREVKEKWTWESTGINYVRGDL